MKMTNSGMFGIWVWLFALAPASFSVELPVVPFSNLKSEEFCKRESAQTELLAWAREQGEPATDELFRQSRVADDPEVRERCLGVLRELVNDEYLKDGEGYIGIRMAEMPANVPGDPQIRNVIRVSDVEADSAAAQAGLMVGDMIVALGDEVWLEGSALLPFGKRIRGMKPGTKVTLKVLRNGNAMDVEVKLGRRPLRADMPLMIEGADDYEKTERAAKEAYFRRWLERRKSGK